VLAVRDLVVVGAGIVGEAFALAAVRRGWRVTVVERDHRPVGASIRNFGFVTVTGQGEGDTWRRAMRSRDIWEVVARDAGIEIVQRGLWVVARRTEAMAVLEAFARTDMGGACGLYGADEVRRRAPSLNMRGAVGALWSPHELRVESRHAIPQLAHWLGDAYAVDFRWGEEVLDVGSRGVRTASGTIDSPRVVVCPGTHLTGVARPFLASFGLSLTRLQMLRVSPPDGFVLDAPVMSDLSLVRYRGYAALPEAVALRSRLQQELPDALDNGIHLIAVQSADGTLVVGDSHHDDLTPHPFASEAVDALILRQLHEAVAVADVQVVERWTGTYPIGGGSDALVIAPQPELRVVLVTSGTGASTAFALAEEVVDAW
jgi:FAD dependent oxidoreductase TIGR03364